MNEVVLYSVIKKIFKNSQILIKEIEDRGLARADCGLTWLSAEFNYSRLGSCKCFAVPAVSVGAD
jgi:hypothetical protein